MAKYSTINIVFLTLILSIMSCNEEIIYENEGIEIYYLDSLQGISFFDKIIPFKREKIENHTLDTKKYRFAQTGGRNIDLREELEAASKMKKPILFYFTGYGCVTCRKIEKNILNDPEIRTLIEKEFILYPLTVDDRTKLPENYWLEKPYKREKVIGQKSLKTIGGINNYFQIVLTQIGSDPAFIALDKNRILGSFTYTKKQKEFKAFLSACIENFNKK